MARKPTLAQDTALQLLRDAPGGRASASDLQLSIATLNRLVMMGLAAYPSNCLLPEREVPFKLTTKGRARIAASA